VGKLNNVSFRDQKLFVNVAKFDRDVGSSIRKGDGEKNIRKEGEKNDGEAAGKKIEGGGEE